MTGNCEMWKPIDGYNGRYMVSNSGNVKSLFTRHGCHGKVVTHYEEKAMSQFDNGHGYMVVSLRFNGRRKNHYVHRLVADAFVKKCEPYECVNHINYDTKDNRADNLEWCTQKHNIQHSTEHMRKEKSVCRTTNTGHKYIREVVQHGLVRYKFLCKRLNAEKQFLTLEDAIAFKQVVLQTCHATGMKWR